MQFIQIDGYIINPAHIAWATKRGHEVALHLTVQYTRPNSPSVYGPKGPIPEAELQHTELYFHGPAADALWQALGEQARQVTYTPPAKAPPTAQ